VINDSQDDDNMSSRDLIKRSIELLAGLNLICGSIILLIVIVFDLNIIFNISIINVIILLITILIVTVAMYIGYSLTEAALQESNIEDSIRSINENLILTIIFMLFVTILIISLISNFELLFGIGLTSKVDLGDLLTPITIFISAIALLYGWQKDRREKSKEYEDKLKNNVNITLAKLERWTELRKRFFQDVQEYIPQVASNLMEEKNNTEEKDSKATSKGAKRHFFENLYKIRAQTYQKILDEQIERDFEDLQNYPKKIGNSFLEAINRHKSIDSLVYMDMILIMQLALDYVISGKEEQRYTESDCINIMQRIINMLNLESGYLMIFEMELLRNDLDKLMSQYTYLNSPISTWKSAKETNDGKICFNWIECFSNRVKRDYEYRLNLIKIHEQGKKDSTDIANDPFDGLQKSVDCYAKAIKETDDREFPGSYAGYYLSLKYLLYSIYNAQRQHAKIDKEIEKKIGLFEKEAELAFDTATNQDIESRIKSIMH
jgi:hypothetical protein